MNDGELTGDGRRESFLLTYRTPATDKAGRAIELRAGASSVGRVSERREDPRPFEYRGRRVFVAREAMEAQGPRDLFELLNRGF